MIYKIAYYKSLYLIILIYKISIYRSSYDTVRFCMIIYGNGCRLKTETGINVPSFSSWSILENSCFSYPFPIFFPVFKKMGRVSQHFLNLSEKNMRNGHAFVRFLSASAHTSLKTAYTLNRRRF